MLDNKLIIDIKKMLTALKWSSFSVDGGKTKFILSKDSDKLYAKGNKTNLKKLYLALKEQYKDLKG
jgi:hypothetical protein